MNEKFSDLATLVGVVDPDANSAGDHSTDWINLKNWGGVQGIVLAGVLGTGATLDAKFEQAKDGAGTDAKDVEGKLITQLVKASNGDEQAVIEVRGDELDADNGFTHVRLTLTVGTATSDCAAVVLGHQARYAPAVATTVVEVVS